jgi:hypothetical protein
MKWIYGSLIRLGILKGDASSDDPEYAHCLCGNRLSE